MSSTGLPAGAGAPQFQKAEYVGKAGPDACSICGQPAGKWYFRVNGAMSCRNCAQAAKNAAPRDTHARFVRALLFGAGAAVLGLILYSTFGIVSGLVIGYLSLGVGYLVGKAMMMGARGVGGRRYQIAAVLYTYAAVSMSAIPIGVAYGIKHRPAERAQKAPANIQVNPEQRAQSAAEADQQLQQEFASGAAKPLPARAGAPKDAGSAANSGSAAQATVTPSTGAPSADGSEATRGRVSQARNTGGVRSSPNFAAALGYLALMGLASPFLELQDPIQGGIGLIILLVGIRIAWQLTEAKPAEIVGPFENAARG
jgi:hypothetical protein